MTATARYTIGVVIERVVARSAWAEHLWRAVGVLASPPDLPAWTPLGGPDGHARFYAGPFDLDLHRSDTATYRDNLASAAPHIWIACRATAGQPPIEVVRLTADPAEGESYTEAGDDIVEQVPMPPELVALLAGFVADHHVERTFYKRRRDGARHQQDEED